MPVDLSFRSLGAAEAMLAFGPASKFSPSGAAPGLSPAERQIPQRSTPTLAQSRETNVTVGPSAKVLVGAAQASGVVAPPFLGAICHRMRAAQPRRYLHQASSVAVRHRSSVNARRRSVRGGESRSKPSKLTLRHTFGYGLSCHKRDDNNVSNKVHPVSRDAPSVLAGADSIRGRSGS